jgi:ribosomal-protein-serine acetyltransferase
LFPYQLDDVEIHPLVEQEAEIFFAVVEQNRERLGKWMGWVQRVRNVDEARVHIQNYPDRGGFHAGMWRGERLIGVYACRYVDIETHEAEIGYWLTPDAEGKGLVTRVSKAVIDYLFEQKGVRRIKIQAFAANERSRAVAERLGFTLKAIERGDDGIEDAVYMLLVEDWEKSI